jgi:hypothetical protein
MSFLPASRTKRNLFKIASLGLAGLLAGLFAGCTDSLESSTTSYTHVASDSFNPDAAAEAQTSLPKSLDETQIPALRHPPSTRHLQAGSVHTVSQSVPATGGFGY